MIEMFDDDIDDSEYLWKEPTETAAAADKSTHNVLLTSPRAKIKVAVYWFRTLKYMRILRYKNPTHPAEAADNHSASFIQTS